MKNQIFLIICLGIIVVTFDGNEAKAQVTDIDGKTYSTVTIGTQVWMAEDLEVKHYRNGDPIQYIACDNESSTDKLKYADQWDTTTTGAYCIAVKPFRDCYIQGGRSSCILYNGYAANDSRGLAPEGWHIPSKEEWGTLISHLGGINTAGVMMKSKSGWDTKYAKNGNNKSGFNSLPTGNRENGIHMGYCQYAWYWTSTEVSPGISEHLQLGYQVDNSSALTWGNTYWKTGNAIRCIKD